MKLSTPVLAAAAAGVVAADDTTSPTLVTITNFITNNDRTYTRTATQTYTGQDTTTPTSGTYTETMYRGGDPFRTMTYTYGEDTTVVTSKIVTGPERTYTRPWSRTMHTTEAEAYKSSKAEFNSKVQAEMDGGGEGHPYGGDDWDDSDSDDDETTSANAAARLGLGSGAVALAAVLLL
ncbi:uncharacterized protein CXQ87_001514 [Candidozyma duobushaemuli]|uniref:Uncharacterized protein n=2 Tax=Candidozyma TaxID=3303203 RepID=A0ABX8I1Z2_9ASCO|nr:uncharacterized protein CXQ87_001514 [[Candida] duobushaemulonis]PVH18583.1 hypothetical protein CXQ87_001514 [[Candida] duobushaemulonis]QWU87104.1 hypothetical protein CA3LBN_001322 [[Candida] haemuloni]